MYNKFSLLNEEPFIFYKFHNLIIYLLVITQITSCTNLTPINSVYKKEAFKVLIQKTLLQINEIYSSNEPIHPPSQSEFPLVKKLPGSNFKINPKSISTATFDPDGKILLSSGDYTIPVMTYCMKQSRSSPNAHTYRLSQLKGKRSSIIRDINSKALLKFSAHDIQILSWSLQAGLKYEELTQESKRIIDEIVPYAQAELKESLIETIEKKWNKVSDTTVGMIPSFDQSSEDLISELGELGQKINKIRLFKKILEKAGNDFDTLRGSLKDATQSLKNEDLSSKAPWSKINERVYARFITQKNFQEIGYVQIRVLPDSKNRNVSSNSVGKVTLDILSWLANPNDPSIQPLSFSMLYGYGGIAVIPALAEAPIALAALLAVVLASQVIDWDKFFELKNVAEGTNDAEVRKALEEGINTLNKTHDELEKPLKEAGIITGKTKNTSSKNEGDTREFTKPGGNEQLQKDFEKIEGEKSTSQDGLQVKTRPDGTRIVNRPPTEKSPTPTLEIQPPKNEFRTPSERVKVRYP